MHGVADPGGDVEVQQLGSRASEHHVERLDIAVGQSLVLPLRPLARFGFGPVAFLPLRVELSEARGIRMGSRGRVEQIECDIYCFPVAKVPVSGDELVTWLP